MIIRKELFARRYRYRIHQKEIAGKPDLILPKYRSAIFINRYFLHGHDGHLFKSPQSPVSQQITFCDKTVPTASNETVKNKDRDPKKRGYNCQTW